ncbi:hypothetical protein G7B40_026875 [Aetokthonos hydrillicola Thurmond2011]|uniref:Uncharacterized protein n=1 Tax=Aetokthonos hydrillicola Thurmond2011 TaxID=2712845 RepID=A0AAP5MCK2_9CYAN|nr:hypothetical protein [Aetokthonos hydrillicola CCALA 1050]MBW4589307.1 hypothetical protein [Aetokthonos hydrillicola CCALA 1050]MDR9898159.1 hypothetical protein [Aetokthonos hydrillicola Thurmond2011]
MSSPLERTLAIRQRFQSLAGWMAGLDDNPAARSLYLKKLTSRPILNQPDTPPGT